MVAESVSESVAVEELLPSVLELDEPLLEESESELESEESLVEDSESVLELDVPSSDVSELDESVFSVSVPVASEASELSSVSALVLEPVESCDVSVVSP